MSFAMSLALPSDRHHLPALCFLLVTFLPKIKCSKSQCENELFEFEYYLLTVIIKKFPLFSTFDSSFRANINLLQQHKCRIK